MNIQAALIEGQYLYADKALAILIQTRMSKKDVNAFL